MVTNELLEYVKREYLKGLPLDDIKKVLLNNNWSVGDVDKALNSVFLEKQNTLNKNQKGNFKMLHPYPQKECKKSKKTLVLALILFIFLAVFSGSIYAYSLGYFNSSTKIIQNMEENISHVKSFSFKSDTNIDWSLVQEDIILNEFSMGLSSARNFSFILESKYEFFKLDDIKFQNDMLFKLGAINVGLETRFLDKTLYFQIKELPALAMLKNFLIGQNKWLKFTSADLEKDILPIDSSLVEQDFIKDLNIKPFLLNKDFFVLNKRLPVEEINKKKSYHFIFSLNQENIKKYLLAEVEKSSLPEDFDLTNSFDLEKKIEDIFSSMKNFHGEIWIDQKTDFPTKLFISFSMGEVLIQNTTFFHNWNEFIQIEKPAESFTLEEFQEKFLNPVLTNAENTKEIKEE